MKREIVLGNPTLRKYGVEYPVRFLENGRVVHRTVRFANYKKKGFRWINKTYSKEFSNAKIIKRFGKWLRVKKNKK